MNSSLHLTTTTTSTSTTYPPFYYPLPPSPATCTHLHLHTWDRFGRDLLLLPLGADFQEASIYDKDVMPLMCREMKGGCKCVVE